MEVLSRFDHAFSYVSLFKRRSEQQRTLTSTSASSDSSVVTCDDARRDYVGEGGKEIWEEGSHGLACIPRCSCPLSNDAVPLKPAYKTAVYAYLRKAVVAPPTAADDVEPRLHKRRFQVRIRTFETRAWTRSFLTVKLHLCLLICLIPVVTCTCPRKSSDTDVGPVAGVVSERYLRISPFPGPTLRADNELSSPQGYACLPEVVSTEQRSEAGGRRQLRSLQAFLEKRGRCQPGSRLAMGRDLLHSKGAVRALQG